MKKYNLIYVIVLLTLCAGCSDWLDVRPRTEMKDEDMYASENGFRNVLIGAYVRMVTSELYGENTTTKVPELLAQHWQTSTSSTAKKTLDNIRKFNFKDENVKEVIGTMWVQYYKTIANLNSMLKEMQGKETLFRTGDYDLIKGEALGLRAFLHLDILRLWGPVPGNDVNSSQSAIPYLTEMTKDPNKALPLSYGKVLEMILADLEEAEKLLAGDPVIECKNGVLNLGYGAILSGDFKRPEDEFWYYRQNRFNYYAVKATKARYYQWIGEDGKAVICANEVIDALNPEDGSQKFSLANSVADGTPDNDTGDRIMSCEHIFSLHNPMLEDIIRPLFIDFGGYTQKMTYITTAYEKTVHPNDIRFDKDNYWEERSVPLTGSMQNMFKKFWVNETTSTQLMPLIRLPEMYFIVMECGSMGEAQAKFRAFRISRNMDSSIDAELTDAPAVRRRLEKEYRKEFYGEGQMFFWYKRHNTTKLTWPVALEIESSQFVVPRPDSQTVFE